MIVDGAHPHLHCYCMYGWKGHSRHAIFLHFHITLLNFVVCSWYSCRSRTKTGAADSTWPYHVCPLVFQHRAFLRNETNVLKNRHGCACCIMLQSQTATQQPLVDTDIMRFLTFQSQRRCVFSRFKERLS